MEKAESCSKQNEEHPNITYAYSSYIKGGGVYIVALENGETLAELTINLQSYGLRLPYDHVVVPTYKLDLDIFLSFIDELAEEVVCTIGYGPFDAHGDIVKLRKNWKDKAVPLESLYETNN